MADDPRKVRTRFIATDDGQQLHVTEVGVGPPLVCCNGVGVSTFFWSYLVEAFRRDHRIVLWDYRGHGRSSLPADPEHADLSIERHARDLACILDALGLEDPVLIGHSMGCQVILQLAVDQPGRARALIPMLGTFGRPLDTLLDSPLSKPLFDVIHKVALGAGRGGRRLFRPLVGSPWAVNLARRSGLVDRHYANRRDLEMYLEHLNHIDPRVLFRSIELMKDHDLGPELPGIETPTLVIAAENDLFTPLHRSRTLVERLPHAELFVIAEGSHAAIVEQPEAIHRRIARFLGVSVEDRGPAVSDDGGGGDDETSPPG